jgi:HrpA-like RNA helicase
MARLFTKLPESIFVKIQELVNQIETTPALLMAEYEEEDQPPPPPIEYLIDDPLPTLVDFDDNKTCENVLKTDSLPENNCSTVENMEDSPFETHGVDTSESHRYDTDSRLKVFQESRKEFPLPIDDINVPSEASVTIIRGGFGSGKSLRYPSMLSLLSKDDTNIVVVHPVAIFCEVTAQRVASEQGLEIGAPGCPIGFGSKSLMLSESRRISFVTPLEILSKCMEDSLLMENVTHLIIDEVQERTADMDMVVAMSKHIMRERAKHEMLPPFRVTLLSTFTDTSLLEACFAKDGHAITVIDSPEAESHPIQVFHLNNTEEDEFPESIQAKRLRGHHGHDREVLADYDEALCIAASKVVTQSLLRDDIFDGGSILVFLPGVQEIRLTARLLYGKFRKIEAKGRYNGQIPPTLFLHPNIDAEELQQCFQPCPKIILATDIAESIISIPDCRVVIDVGRCVDTPYSVSFLDYSHPRFSLDYLRES